MLHPVLNVDVAWKEVSKNTGEAAFFNAAGEQVGLSQYYNLRGETTYYIDGLIVGRAQNYALRGTITYYDTNQNEVATAQRHAFSNRKTYYDRDGREIGHSQGSNTDNTVEFE